jgi:hypothetical protein
MMRFEETSLVGSQFATYKPTRTKIPALTEDPTPRKCEQEDDQMRLRSIPALVIEKLDENLLMLWTTLERAAGKSSFRFCRTRS